MRRFLNFALLMFLPLVASSASVDLVQHVSDSQGFVRGADRYYPVQLGKDVARRALADGGMWIGTPDGKRVFARSVRLIDRADGIRTWIGKVGVVGGERSVVLTVGPDATFGSLVTADGEPMRLTTSHGQTYLVRRDSTQSPPRAGLPPLRVPDFRIPPASSPLSYSIPQTLASNAAGPASASSPAAPVDVLLGYTPGMVTSLGSTSAVLTRLNYLVDLTNQAYADSEVSGRIHLAGTLAVNYPDNSDDNQVLDDLASISPTGPLAALRSRQMALGADLVSLVRPFSYSGQGGYCGLGFLLGAGEQPYTTSSAGYGYSTVSDGTDSAAGYYCLDTTLAHELGHNMGLAHDQADASGPGAFSYAYGWRQTLSSGSFATIMAYATGSQQPLAYFADPNITLCNGNRCGDPTVANQTLALNQTMPVAAAFRSHGKARLDLNGDGYADLLLQNSSTGGYTEILEGSNFSPSSSAVRSVASGYRIAAVGDLNGDGVSDLVWTSAAQDLYFWINDGSGSFTTNAGPGYSAGWRLVGTGDINGDGKDDLLWSNDTTHQFSVWFMNGTAVSSIKTIAVTAGYHIAAIGDLNGDGFTDLVWTSAANDLYVWSSTGSGSFSSTRSLDYPSGWQLVGAGDMNLDGKSDLVWVNSASHQFAYWLMSGATRTGYKIISVAAGYSIAGIDRYVSGADGILWTSASNDLYVWRNDGSGSFTSIHALSYPAGSGGYYYDYPSGWSLVSDLPSLP